MKLFRFFTNLSLACMGNALQIAVAAGMAACAVGLMALYPIKYIEETPEWVSIQCRLGIVERPECPRYGEEMNALEGELEALVAKTRAAEGKLARLKLVEDSVDTITLFDTHDDPHSDLSITVGTRYTRIVDAERAPSYFCYINLGHGDVKEDRHLSIRNPSGDVALNRSVLRKAGVSQETLDFARSVCTPTLIGG